MGRLKSRGDRAKNGSGTMMTRAILHTTHASRAVVSDVPLSTSGVIRLKGNKQCGARACSTPLARDPVSNSVSSRSWCASQKSFSSEAPTKGDAPCVSPRAGSRVS